MVRASFATDGKGGLSRNVPIRTAANCALLVVDVQVFNTVPGDGEFPEVDPANVPDHLAYYFDRVAGTVLPNIRRLQDACRRAGSEVLFTVIESLTTDGRDRGLDYKITGFNVPRGSPWAKMPEAVAPRGDEIVIPKTSSSVFMSTNIDYVLRNLEIEQLIVAGLLTDQCVESVVRDACDLGYLVTVPEDACGTFSEERHRSSLSMYKGYCRIVDTASLVAELDGLARLAAE
jgi:ureidoacrylate peracid hydrolase